MRRAMVGILVTAFVGLASGACDVGIGSSPANLNNLEIGPGLTPTYSWEGDGITELSVQRVNAVTEVSESVVWKIARVRGEDLLKSPVGHGEVPHNATESARLEPVLTAGVTYEVTISNANSFAGTARKVKRFTPP